MEPRNTEKKLYLHANEYSTMIFILYSCPNELSRTQVSSFSKIQYSRQDLTMRYNIPSNLIEFRYSVQPILTFLNPSEDTTEDLTEATTVKPNLIPSSGPSEIP